MEEQYEELNDILTRLFVDKQRGFVGINALIKRARPYGIKVKDIKAWYKRQPVNQIIVPRRQPIDYHKIIGDGDGYQADIIFFPYPRTNR